MEVHYGDVLQYRSKVSWKSWLQTRILIFNDFENWVSRLEFQGRRDCQLTFDQHCTYLASTWNSGEYKSISRQNNKSSSVSAARSLIYNTDEKHLSILLHLIATYSIAIYSIGILIFITTMEEFLSSCFNFFCRVQVLWKLKRLKRRPKGYLHLCLKISSNTRVCNTCWLSVKGPIKKNYYKIIGRGYICAT